MAARLRTVLVFVADPSACAVFYEQHLGLVPAGQATAAYRELDAGGVLLGLHQAYGPDGPRAEPTGDASNPHKLVFAVDDVTALHGRLAAAGVQVLDLRDDGFDAFDVEGHRFSVVHA